MVVKSISMVKPKMLYLVETLLLALVVAVSFDIGRVNANPDVWVTAGVIFRFEDTRVNGLTYVWRFDEYYSSRAIQIYDSNRDGTFGPEEVARLRAESFDPLARFDYYVHVWGNGENRKTTDIRHFTASIEDNNLVYRFTVPLVPSADPSTSPVVASLFDKGTVVDFRFSETDFLLVDGTMGAGCKFRVARGKGTRSGHSQVVTLKCGA